MRRSPREEAERWLTQAEADLRWAEDLAERGGYHIACFLAQQIGEKALKGYLYAQGAEVVLGHSIERLCAEAAHHHAGFREHVQRWAVLDAYYVPTRYPNSLPDSIPALVYTRHAAQEAVGLAAEVVRVVRGLLGPLPP